MRATAVVLAAALLAGCAGEDVAPWLTLPDAEGHGARRFPIAAGAVRPECPPSGFRERDP